MNYLSPVCAKEESKLQALEYRDIRLKPKLAKVCSEERAVYCKVSDEATPDSIRIHCLVHNLKRGRHASSSCPCG
jgi:Golgi apparatus protein 1